MPDQPKPDAALIRLLGIMARLRAPDGCPWDQVQDFASIAPYTIEEAHEVADAIRRGPDFPALLDELGDLLFQVVYHAQMASELGRFGFAEVAEAISDKMIRRHPHIFGDGVATPGWETIKAAERAQAGEGGALDGIALALPALMRAEKLQKRAARTGFDWTDRADVRAKVVEELDELDAAPDADATEDEAGDLLFAAVNLVRHSDVDAEAALRRANAKFERRFRAMEAMAGATFAELSLEEKEALWGEAKKRGL